MVKDRMAKRSIGSLMRKKLSDITNSQYQEQTIHPTQQENELDTCVVSDKACIQQLLKIKALQHEILWRAALLKGNNVEVVVGLRWRLRFGVRKFEGHDSKIVKGGGSVAANEGASGSTSSSTSTKNARKEKVEGKRNCARLESHELKPLENLFEIEDAKYHVIQSRTYLRSNRAEKEETGYNSASRNETPRCSFGIPLRKSVERGQSSYKDTNSSKKQSAKTRASRLTN
ncbi:hypothetical protein RIF29_27608 [Crotalaria pallida]|uniref:Uncharacterized protein n=1 Tax=Crotalaria pallida TaxID=3830 RepID=A0AAN9EPD5_CROPI